MTQHALLVSSGGGHLSELHAWADRIDGLTSVTWATPRSPQSVALLADADVCWIPDVPTRDYRGAIRTLPLARRILRDNAIDVVISTGAAVAIPFLLAARVARLPGHYVESATRVEGPSLTGRLAGLIPGVHRYTQHEKWAGERWTFAGSVYDGFAGASTEPEAERDRLKVVVTVGSMPFSFDRLLRGIDKALPEHAEVLIQTGHTQEGTRIEGRRTWVPFLDHDELAKAMADADVVICHAGVGSTLLALTAGRWPILVPRRAEHKEHVDDHQVQIAELLHRAGLGLAREPDDISATDLRTAAGRRVDHSGTPPRVRLVERGRRGGSAEAPL